MIRVRRESVLRVTWALLRYRTLSDTVVAYLSSERNYLRAFNLLPCGDDPEAEARELLQFVADYPDAADS